MFTASFFVIFLLCWRCWYTLSFTTPYQREEFGLFSDSSIVDLHNGSMESLQLWLNWHPVTLVIFYTSWSGQSIKSVPELISAHHMFSGSSVVSIIGINCWVGQCRQSFQSLHFPRLFLYHTHYPPIEYLDEITAPKIVKFLRNVIRPYSYIESMRSLQEFQEKYGNHVLFFVHSNELKRSLKFRAMFHASLNLLSHINRPEVGIILQDKLATSVGLPKYGNLLINSHFFRTKYFSNVHQKFTTNEIVEWMIKNTKKRVSELTPNATGNHFYISQLKHPSLVLALPNPWSDSSKNSEVFKKFHQIARDYYDCSCLKKPEIDDNKCKTQLKLMNNIYVHGSKCLETSTSCQSSGLALFTFNDNKNGQTRITLKFLQEPCVSLVHSPTGLWNLYSSCCYKQLYNQGRNYNVNINLESSFADEAAKKGGSTKCAGNAPCCSSKRIQNNDMKRHSVHGLACITNHTLDFYLLDSERYSYLLDNAGIDLDEDKKRLFVIDLPSKQNFIFNETVTYTSLAKFVLDFTFGNLLYVYQSLKKTSQHDVLHQNIVELSTETFQKEVIHENEHVLVMFYANWCGVCKPANLVYLQLMKTYQKHKIKFTRIDNDKFELPWHYTAPAFPSFVLFPAKNKQDSIHFPEDKQITVGNLMQFVSMALS